MHILCTICSDLINHTENIYITKCGHIFHYHCLAQWIERSKSCPQCRNRVSENGMFRVYPTISNEASGVDAASLQSQLDDAKLQLILQKATVKETEEKMTALTAEMKKTQEALKTAEKKLTIRESAIATITQHLEFVKIQNKETEKLKAENETLKKNLQTLNGLQKVLNATSDEVEQMLEGYTDLRTIATFATALKRALCESESKKNKSRDRLVTVKQHLEMEKKKCAELQMKFVQIQEQLSETKRKYAASKNKRKANEAIDSSLYEDSERAVKQQRLSSPGPVSNNNINESNASLNTLVNRIENAESPYLNLKQSSLALATLQRPANHMVVDGKLKPSEYAMVNTARNIATKKRENKPTNSQRQDLSIFHKKAPSEMHLIDKTEPIQPELDVSYDGLGGHSKLDLFPIPKRSPTLWKPKSNIPKITAKHKLRRPQPSGTRDVGKMLQEICSNTDKS